MYDVSKMDLSILGLSIRDMLNLLGVNLPFSDHKDWLLKSFPILGLETDEGVLALQRVHAD